MQTAQEVARTIEALAKEQGLSINRILSDCGLASGAFANMKMRGNMPSADRLHRISKRLGVTVDWLLTGEQAANELTIYKGDTIVKGSIKRFDSLDFNDRVHAVLLEKRWTTSEAGTMLGISVDAVRFYRKERAIYPMNEWDKDTAKRIASALDIRLEQQGDDCLNNEELLKFETPLTRRLNSQLERTGYDTKKLAVELKLDEISVISWFSGERLIPEYWLKMLNESILVLSDEAVEVGRRWDELDDVGRDNIKGEFAKEENRIAALEASDYSDLPNESGNNEVTAIDNAS